jgi:endonuclease/exonuclease/phosphatase family metal-dependent hydrolase
MFMTGLAAAAALMAPAEAAPLGGDGLRPAPPIPAPVAAEAPRSAEISVLTYNVKGLPRPLAWGRAAALKRIGRELAQMRAEGRQPDVVLIQEGFREEVADLVRASGYRNWVQGPTRTERPGDTPGRGYRAVRYRLYGEGWGKFTSSGLHVLSDLPISKIDSVVYRYCAGLDCLANKGAVLVRLTLPGGQAEVDIVNTHLNSKRKARVPMARTLKAHNLQTDELMSFVAGQRTSGRPMLMGGDFNVKDAPDRYGYRAQARSYKVVSEFCGQADAGCQGETPPADTQPWLKSQDLQAFEDGRSSEVRPVRVQTLFSKKDDGGRLSDHDAYLVRYRISYRPADAAGGEFATADASK